ncbi:hypothetical protein CDCA_CDCA01G0440 [Cyanidium caldarium]|uniref:HVA22-like protein n=1 Tax=Cyanidium caldarium TaxID=2771 RepID=A0AAV9IQP9_CYACA|nr:hypothetical protein CDCA_CDCA01G0440 [Cyanidium caldarium]|eukprot:ctg_1033.g440
MLGAFLSTALCTLFGYLYPAYATYKALKRSETAEIKQWLMYWVVHAGFSVAEAVGDWVASGFPFYHEAKVAFLLWLVLPHTRGATVLYQAYVQQYLTRYETDIDRAAEDTRQRVQQAAGDTVRRYASKPWPASVGALAQWLDAWERVGTAEEHDAQVRARRFPRSSNRATAFGRSTLGSPRAVQSVA